MAPVFRAENLGVRYGHGPEVLSDITMALAPGSFYFLTGPSGAGKTSLLRVMYHAHRPSRGLVYLFGKDTSLTAREELARLRRRIGVIFQDFRLVPHLTARENVALALRVAGAPRREIEDHVPELLSWVGLSEHLDALSPTLSGGQQQRVAIARAVINRPQLILADEPTGNVDSDIALRLMYLFEELNRMGTTVVIATHNDALVRQFDHPVVRLEEGRIVTQPGEEP